MMPKMRRTEKETTGRSPVLLAKSQSVAWGKGSKNHQKPKKEDVAQ